MDSEQIADWLVLRLGDDAAEKAWTEAVAGATERALVTPLENLLSKDAFEELLAAWTTAERFDGGGSFVMFFASEAIPEARTFDDPIKDWLSDEAQTAIVEFSRRPGWVPEGWVRAVFAQKATEELVYEILQRGLRDFSTLIPRILEKVLPGGLGKLARLGTKASTRAFDEVERLLEGEIKKWLERGTRRSVDAAAQLAVDRLDSSAGMAGRENLIRYAFDQSPATHLAPLGPDAHEALQEIVSLVARDLGRSPQGPASIQSAGRRLYARYAPRPLSDLLADAGLLEMPLPARAWARATWPAARLIVQGPEVRAFLVGLAADLREQLRIEKE